MAEPIDPFASTKLIQKRLADLGVLQSTALTEQDILKNRQLVSGLPGLGPVDYDSQAKKAKEDAQRLFFLRMAERGFAAAGATPQPGERGNRGALSVLSRELFSPLAGDAGVLAGQLSKQEQAFQAAKRGDDARLSQASLAMAQQQIGRDDAASDQQFNLARSMSQRNYSPTKGLQRTKPGGKPEDFMGFVYTDPLTGIPGYAIVSPKGTMEDVPGEQLSEFRKLDTVSPIKATGAAVVPRVISFPERDEKGRTTRWRSANVIQARQIIPDTLTGPRFQFGPEILPLGSAVPITVMGADGKPRNIVEGVDFVATDEANYEKPVGVKYYLRKDLNEDELAEATSILGDIKPGEGVQRWTFAHKVNPEQTKIWYDIKGGRARLTPAKANQLLTTEPQGDVISAEGKRVGNTTKDLTVSDGKGGTTPVQAVLMQYPNAVFKWKIIGENGGFVDDQESAWRTGDKDTVWRSVRPALDQAFKRAVGRRTELSEDTRNKLAEQVLRQPDLMMLAPLSGAERSRALKDIIDGRVRALSVDPSEAAAAPPVALTDFRNVAMTRDPSDGVGSPVLNPRIINPWQGRRGAESEERGLLQLGTGSHDGFTKGVAPSEADAARASFPAIQKAFSEIYPGRTLGDAEERVLLFSGLWKNLRGVAEGQGVRTLSNEDFKEKFDSAVGKYNKASSEYKSAGSLDVGRNRTLQDTLDENTDALRDNVLMLRFKDQGGAWFDGTWLAEMRGSGLGELVESWSGSDGKSNALDVPSARWQAIARPDNQLNEADLELKNRVRSWMQGNTIREGGFQGDVGLDQFERAAEYLSALNRYKVRAFQMIEDSRPSDKDIEILLGAFVGDNTSDTEAFARLAELQLRHVQSLSRGVNRGLNGKAVFAPTFLATLDHTSRALARGALRDVDPRVGGRAKETADLFRTSAASIKRAAESVSGRILPGNRGGAVSPLSGDVDEESTANLYRLVTSAATREFPNLTEREAVTKFVDSGLHLTRYLGTFGGGARQSTPPGYYGRDGRFNIR